MHISHLPDKITLGDISRAWIGWYVYLKTSMPLLAKNGETINYSDEGVRACISVCVAIFILLVSYILRGVLEDKESWLHIKFQIVINFLSFKKKK